MIDEMMTTNDDIMGYGTDVKDSSMMMDEDDMMMSAFLDEAAIVDEVTEQALETIAALPKTRQVSDSTHETDTSSSLNVVVLPDGTPTNVVTTELPLVLTGRPAIRLYLSCNPDYLSPYQCLIRKNIELFEATELDVSSRVKGRNKSIVLGQLGIRCCFCAHIPPANRDRGSMYFPSNMHLIYQAAQILSQEHLLGSCQYIRPPELRDQLVELRKQKSMATVGKEYWAKTAQVLGVFEDQFGLRFEKRLGYIRKQH